MEVLGRSTKDEIVELLKRNKQLTVTELAKELQVTEMAVRRHIGKLEKEGLIEATLVRQHVGRPMYVYELSTKGEDLFPKQYKDFAVGILEDLQKMGQEELLGQLVQSYTNRLKQKIEKHIENKPTFEGKVREIAAAQQQNGYMVEIENGENGAFFMKKQNCPLLSVAKKTALLCESEYNMYKELLPQADIKMMSCMSQNECACIYQILPKEYPYFNFVKGGAQK
ncbi:MAG: helix-turn-helix transcriptional regulator [Ectobacillus sp.]